MNIEGVWTVGKFVRVDQPTAGLVVGVGGKVIPGIKFARRFDCFSEPTHHAMYFLLRWLVTSDGIRPRQTGEVLPKTVARNECVKILRRAEIIGIVIPASHVGPWRSHALALAKRLE